MPLLILEVDHLAVAAEDMMMYQICPECSAGASRGWILQDHRQGIPAKGLIAKDIHLDETPRRHRSCVLLGSLPHLLEIIE
jgi:hypothetical protein